MKIKIEFTVDTKDLVSPDSFLSNNHQDMLDLLKQMFDTLDPKIISENFSHDMKVYFKDNFDQYLNF